MNNLLWINEAINILNKRLTLDLNVKNYILEVLKTKTTQYPISVIASEVELTLQSLLGEDVGYFIYTYIITGVFPEDNEITSRPSEELLSFLDYCHNLYGDIIDKSRDFLHNPLGFYNVSMLPDNKSNKVTVNFSRNDNTYFDICFKTPEEIGKLIEILTSCKQSFEDAIKEDSTNSKS